MAKYLFVYHGGKHPETDEEMAEVMDAWGQWMGGMGAAVVDGGNPVGLSTTVNPDGSVVDNRGHRYVARHAALRSARALVRACVRCGLEASHVKERESVIDFSPGLFNKCC